MIVPGDGSRAGAGQLGDANTLRKKPDQVETIYRY